MCEQITDYDFRQLDKFYAWFQKDHKKRHGSLIGPSSWIIADWTIKCEFSCWLRQKQCPPHLASLVEDLM